MTKSTVRIPPDIPQRAVAPAPPPHLPSFAEVINPGTPNGVEEFVSAGFPNKLWHRHGDAARLGDLLASDYKRLLDAKCVYVAALGRSDDGLSNVRIPMKSPQEIQKHYDAGFVIYWHAIQMDATMKEWMRGMCRELGLLPEGTRLSAFASHRGSGLTTHYDNNDNIVIQMNGSKSWRVAENTLVKNPTVGYTLGDPVFPHQRQLLREVPASRAFYHRIEDSEYTPVEMVAGDVMFMPRGMWHGTTTSQAHSLHFNLQLGLPTSVDFANFFVRECVPFNGDEHMRVSVPYAFEGNQLSAEARRTIVEGMRSVLLDSINSDTFMDSVLDRASFGRFFAASRSAGDQRN